MKNYKLLILTILSFSLIIVLTALITGSASKRLFVYNYPNGYIANATLNNQELLGKNIREKDLPTTKAKEKIKFDIVSKIGFIKDFWQHFIIVFLFVFTALYFLIKNGDFYVFMFFLVVGLLVFFDFILLAFNDYWIFFFFFLFGSAASILNLVIRFKGKEVSFKWVLPELLIIILLCYISNKNLDYFDSFIELGASSILLFGLIFIITNLYDLIKYDENTDNKIKKLSLGIGLAIVIFVPYIVFRFNLYYQYPQLKFVVFTSFLLLPVLFVYGIHKYSFLPEQLYFNSSIVNLFLVLIYSFFMFLFHYLFMLSPLLTKLYTIHKLEFNAIALLLVVSSMKTLKNYISRTVIKRTFSKNSLLTKTYQEIVDMITVPIYSRKFLETLSKKITVALNVENISILVPMSSFPYNIASPISIIKINDNSDVWQFFKDNNDITNISYIMHGSGKRAAVYKFMGNNDFQLAFPILSNTNEQLNTSMVAAVLMIGEKKDKSNFTLAEIQFIKECARLAGLLLFNYQLRKEEISDKQSKKYFNLMSIREKTLSFDIKNKKRWFSFRKEPYAEISGDYLDVSHLDENRSYIFLGDVSGHGLGSGFLVSAITGLIREQIKLGASLIDTFTQVNVFLIERYAGTEFMSLIGGIYNRQIGEFEYINAGHLPIFLVNVSGNVTRHNVNDKVLGVMKTAFSMNKIRLEENDKIILYTDGVTETFNEQDKMFGEDGLRRFLKENHLSTVTDITLALEEELDKFRGNADKSDDITYIVISQESMKSEHDMHNISK